MPLNPAKPLSKSFGIAVFAPRADLDAATNGIPGRVGPFDVRVKRHSALRAKLVEDVFNNILRRVFLRSEE